MMSTRKFIEGLVPLLWLVRFYEIQSLFSKTSDHENTADPKVLCRRLNALKPVDQAHGIKDAIFIEEKALIFMPFGHTEWIKKFITFVAGIVVGFAFDFASLSSFAAFAPSSSDLVVEEIAYYFESDKIAVEPY